MTPTKLWTKQRRKEIREKIVLAIVSLILAWILFSFINVNHAHNTGEEVGKWNLFEIVFANTSEPVYVICDIYTANSDALVIKMQDGSLHEYEAIDVPDDATEVCFKASNLDDYTTYEIVAIR